MFGKPCKQRRCPGVYKSGIAMIPLFGNYRNTFDRGCTVYAVTATVGHVAKCDTCGSSMMAKQYYVNLETKKVFAGVESEA
jgi:hypothetical protein